ncbi:hypothetical protein chiPu_0026221, partial [Chiloscyllium punctatum]|nr:hypothetical protein [Chiloscyllium punctatum]
TLTHPSPQPLPSPGANASAPTRVRVRDGHFPDADVRGHRGEVFAEGEGQQEAAEVPRRQLPGRGDVPGSEQRRHEQADGEDVEQGDGDRVREPVQDHFVDDIAARAHGVPTQAENEDPQTVPHHRLPPLRHLGLSARQRRHAVTALRGGAQP